MHIEPPSHRWMPLLVFAATLLATAVVTWQFWRMLEANDRIRFQSHIGEVKNNIASGLENTVTLLRGGAGLLAARPNVTRDEFRAFVERLDLPQRYPGILGIGWSRRISAADKESVTAAMRSQDEPAFHIWPEQPRAEYFSILYLEPYNARNQTAVGYDMSTEPARRAAMDRSWQTGAALSGKVTLVQEIDAYKQPGFLLYVPVFEGGRIPDAAPERRDKLLGFVYSPLRAVDWLSTILQGDYRPPVSITVYDGLEVKPEALLYSAAAADDDAPPRFTDTVAITLAGQPWTLAFATRPGFDRAADPYLAPGVFLSGLLISLLLTSITWLQTRARQAADDSAARLRRSQQELQQTGKALRASQERLHLALEAARMAVWEWDIHTDQVQGSAELGLLFGHGGDLLQTDYRGFLDRLHPADRQWVDHTLRQAVAECASYETEFRLAPADGGLRWLASRGEVICDDAGKPCSVVGMILDITERKRAEEALKEADWRKNVFLATLAHELRNPLAAISNSLHIIRLADIQQPALQKAQAMAERQLNHLVRLVDDLLDISRIIQGKIRLQKARVELTTVARNAIDACQPQIAAAGHELTVSLPPEPLYLEADATRLTQVVANVLNNAVKYTRSKGHIWLSAGRENNEAVVRVRDDGIGIEAAMLPRIFDMFMQTDGALDQGQNGGMGIGLSLAKQLVRLHQGQIEAHSAGPGQGSEFIIRLPLAAAQEGRTGAGDAGRTAAQRTARRILVVDDNNDSAESIALLLQLLGHVTQVAHDGSAALAKAAAFQPELALVDLGMPGMDGYEVARRLRLICPATRLAAMTGWSSQDHRRRSREAGFHYHLVKPVDLDALSQLLAGLETSLV